MIEISSFCQQWKEYDLEAFNGADWAALMGSSYVRLYWAIVISAGLLTLLSLFAAIGGNIFGLIGDEGPIATWVVIVAGAINVLILSVLLVIAWQRERSSRAKRAQIRKQVARICALEKYLFKNGVWTLEQFEALLRGAQSYVDNNLQKWSKAESFAGWVVSGVFGSVISSFVVQYVTESISRGEITLNQGMPYLGIILLEITVLVIGVMGLFYSLQRVIAWRRVVVQEFCTFSEMALANGMWTSRFSWNSQDCTYGFVCKGCMEDRILRYK